MGKFACGVVEGWCVMSILHAAGGVRHWYSNQPLAYQFEMLYAIPFSCPITFSDMISRLSDKKMLHCILVFSAIFFVYVIRNCNVSSWSNYGIQLYFLSAVECARRNANEYRSSDNLGRSSRCWRYATRQGEIKYTLSMHYLSFTHPRFSSVDFRRKKIDSIPVSTETWDWN